jgi:8-oxo-dGTP diphosphatase
VVATAGALISDSAGNVLVVKPNYRDHWTLPGGICEFGEPPHAGCQREVAEEIGLNLPVGTLLSVDWQPALPRYGSTARPAVYFIFDCGTLRTLSGIRLQADELDDCKFAAAASLGDLLAPFALPRVRAAIAARESGCVRYVPQPGNDHV